MGERQHPYNHEPPPSGPPPPRPLAMPMKAQPFRIVAPPMKAQPFRIVAPPLPPQPKSPSRGLPPWRRHPLVKWPLFVLSIPVALALSPLAGQSVVAVFMMAGGGLLLGLVTAPAGAQGFMRAHDALVWIATIAMAGLLLLIAYFYIIHDDGP